MDAIRVYQVAKLLGLDSKVLTEKLRELGFSVKNYMSLLDNSSVQRIMEHFRAVSRDLGNVEQRIAGRVRGYELAREFNIDHRDLVLLLKAKGYHIKSYMSTIDNESAEEIRNFLRGADHSEINKLIDLGSEIQIRSAYTMRTKGRKVVPQHQNSSSKADFSRHRATHAQVSGMDASPTVLKQPQVRIQEKQANSASTKIKGKTFIVDGLNITHSYSQTSGQICFEALLSVLMEIKRQGGDFICIFDANAMHELEKRGSSGSKSIYLKLLERLPDNFVEVPGGTPADTFILLWAEKNGHLIVTNDRFKPYRANYPWLDEEDGCLFKGTAIRGHIDIPGLGISVTLRRDLKEMTEEFIKQF